jgi:glycosyltransferase involved in cell wall biosynthesis
LDIDIGLVPLTDHPFNWAKTCRKFQEHSILTVPTIASPVGNYKNLPDNVLSRVTTNDTKGWFNAISYYIEHKEERETLGQRAYQYVLDNHDINTFIYERAQFYYDIYADVTGTKRTILWERTPNEKE